MKKPVIDIEKLDEAYSKIQEAMHYRAMNPKLYIKAPSIHINSEDITHDMQDFIEKNARIADPPLFWFREHRGGLEESLKTAICCHDGINTIIEYFKHKSHPNPNPYPYIHIRQKAIVDKRLPVWWGEIEYEVVAILVNGHQKLIILLGYCNFKG